MNPDLTEEDMRRALFGAAQPEHLVAAPQVKEQVPEVVPTQPTAAPLVKKESGKSVYA